MWNAELDESQAGFKTARRNINNLRYADDTTPKAENEEELKNLLKKVKVVSKKAGLKLNMASGPITSVTDFIFLGSKITVDGDCSQEIKRRSLEEKLWQT